MFAKLVSVEIFLFIFDQYFIVIILLLQDSAGFFQYFLRGHVSVQFTLLLNIIKFTADRRTMYTLIAIRRGGFVKVVNCFWQN